MSTTAQVLLEAFDALPPSVQHEVAVAILRRTAAAAQDIPETALHELADDLFQAYDAEEAAHGDPAAK